MKIRLFYLVIAALVIIAFGIVKIKEHRIIKKSQENNQAAYEASVEVFKNNAKNIKDGVVATERGWKYLRAGKTEAAIAVLERASELEKLSRDARLYLGYAYMQKVAGAGKINYFEAKDEVSTDEKVDLLKKAKVQLLVAQRIDPLMPLTNKLLGIVSEKLDNNDSEAKLWYARYEEVSHGDSN